MLIATPIQQTRGGMVTQPVHEVLVTAMRLRKRLFQNNSPKLVPLLAAAEEWLFIKKDNDRALRGMSKSFDFFTARCACAIHTLFIFN